MSQSKKAQLQKLQNVEKWSFDGLNPDSEKSYSYIRLIQKFVKIIKITIIGFIQ